MKVDSREETSNIINSPMSNEQLKITVPIALLIFIISVILSFFGWLTNKTLTDINLNITALGEKIEKLTTVRYDHEIRLKILEEKATAKNKDYEP